MASKMKRLSDCASPLSWLVFYPAGHCVIAMLFQPSILEFALLFFADLLILPFFLPFARALFQRLWPDTRAYFHEVKEDQISALDVKGKSRLILSMMSYPKRRALWCTFFSYVKVIPAYLIVLFAWNHPQRSNLAQFVLM